MSTEIDDFTATYLLGSQRRVSHDEDIMYTGPSPDFFTERTLSRESRESFNLGIAEKEAHEFMNQLNSSDHDKIPDADVIEREIAERRIKAVNPVQRNSSLHVVRENVPLEKSSSLSRSVNDLRTMNAYRPTASLNNHRNRFSCYDDVLFTSKHRDVTKQLSMPLEEKSHLNELQENCSQDIKEFKLLRSALNENMEINLMRTEQSDSINNNNNTLGKEEEGNLERVKRNFSPQYRSQDNIHQSYSTPTQQQQQQFNPSSHVILRKKNLDHYSSQERLFKRYSEMNLDDKYNAQPNGSFFQPQNRQQFQHHLQHPSPRPHPGNNYSNDNRNRPPTYHGLDAYQMSQEQQQREYQSLLRDQAAKSNFERYLKGSFNAHHSFDHLNQYEDPGYGGSGSTSPREMEMATDRMSSRSGSVISRQSRQSQSSAFASVDSGVRMSFIGQHSSLVVVAIDFGTTFSGYAFSFTRDASSVHMMRRWEGGDPGVTNQKTPTTLLLKPDGTFHSFGFGARDFYHDLDVNDAKKWLYFDKFKMTLHASEVCIFTYIMQYNVEPRLSRTHISYELNGVTVRLNLLSGSTFLDRLGTFSSKNTDRMDQFFRTPESSLYTYVKRYEN